MFTVLNGFDCPAFPSMCCSFIAVLPVLSCPMLSYPALSYPMLSCLVLSCLVLSYAVLPCPILRCPVLSYPMLSCPMLSCPVLSCPVLSHPMLFYDTSASPSEGSNFSYGKSDSSSLSRSLTSPLSLLFPSQVNWVGSTLWVTGGK
jgi:hypothetical protein